MCILNFQREKNSPNLNFSYTIEKSMNDVLKATVGAKLYQFFQ